MNKISNPPSSISCKVPSKHDELDSPITDDDDTLSLTSSGSDSNHYRRLSTIDEEDDNDDDSNDSFDQQLSQDLYLQCIYEDAHHMNEYDTVVADLQETIEILQSQLVHSYQIIDDLVFEKHQHQQSTISNSSKFAEHKDTTPSSELQLLFDNGELRRTNTRLEATVTLLRKSFKAYIKGSQRRKEEDQEVIKQLRLKNKALQNWYHCSF